MTDLLLKDIRITRIFWLPAVFSYLVFLLMAFENPIFYMMMGVFISFGLAGIMLLIDESFRTELLIASLPVTRPVIVAARYVSWFVVSAVCLGLYSAGTLFIRGAFKSRAAGLDAVLTAKGMMIFAVLVVVLGSLFLPLYFRLGLGRAFFAFMAAILAIGILFSILSWLIAPLVYQRESLQGVTPGLFASPIYIFSLALMKIESFLGRNLLVALALIVLALALLLSYRLSVLFYTNRDL